TLRPLPETAGHGSAPTQPTQEEETPLGAGHKRTPDADPSDIPPRDETDEQREQTRPPEAGQRGTRWDQDFLDLQKVARLAAIDRDDGMEIGGR
ncbi:MAG: conjugal transfer protein TraG, partial [Gluconobacter oxydans]